MCRTPKSPSLKFLYNVDTRTVPISNVCFEGHHEVSYIWLEGECHAGQMGREESNRRRGWKGKLEPDYEAECISE